jgi:hypothetical protein
LLAVPLCLLPPGTAALLALGTPLYDPGPSGEWAPLGYLMLTFFMAVVGAFMGLIFALLFRRAPPVWRTLAVWLLPMVEGILTPAAGSLAGSLRFETLRRVLDEMLVAGVVGGAAAGFVFALVARLLTPRRSTGAASIDRGD